MTLLISVILFCFAGTFTLSGCQTDEPVAEEEVIETEAVQGESAEEEEIAEESTEIAEEEESEEETADITNMEITGDINMLSGEELSDSIKNGRPVAVMVENHPASRPHSGLIDADIVFEVVDEGGVTRFVAVFSSNDAEIIGPVRSARIYYAEIARSFDPIYLFWGTYVDAYTVLKTMDLDLLDANSDAHVPYTNAGWREPSRDAAIEHTAFIDIQGIKEDAQGHGYSLEGGQSPMNFKIDAIASDRGNITDIGVDFSVSNYKADFSYDSEENKYYKSLGGTPHLDFESGDQLSLNNVVVLITAIEGPIDQWGHMAVRTHGSHEDGQAYYFMDGNVIEGTWGRSSIFDPFEFRDSDGNPILFNRGSTWVCMIQGIDRLSY